MSQYTREPYPSKIVWKQNTIQNQDNNFYWLSVHSENEDIGKEVIANINSKTNVIDIEKSDYNNLTIYLNYEMVNFDESVIITYHGKKVFNENVRCTKSTMAKTLSQRKDFAYIFCSELSVNLQETFGDNDVNASVTMNN